MTFKQVLAGIPQWVANRKPFVLYSKPGEQNLTVAQNSQVSPKSEQFVFAPFRGNPVTINFERVEIALGFDKDFTDKLREMPASGRDEFEKLVLLAKNEIRAGTFSKVVLSRKQQIRGDFDIAMTFAKMLQKYPAAFRYCWFHPETGMWMGATPERLLKSTGRTFSTVALAGTRKADITGPWPLKESDEQQIVTDYIVSQASAVADEITVTGPFTIEAGELAHLKSDISGKFNDGNTSSDLVSMLHPTPAVCGFPKDESLKFILENEGYDRRFYTGFLGETTSDANADLYVNLRCMEISGQLATLYAGCGITADSDPELEYRETAAKLATMKNILYEN